MRGFSSFESSQTSEGGSNVTPRISPLERWQLIQQVQRWRIGALIFFGICIAFIFSNVIFTESTSPLSNNLSLQKERIARINIYGMILDDINRTELLKNIADESSVKAVLVYLDTPGGTVVGGEEIYEQLRLIAEHKPVVAVLRTMATSAGYMAAIGADHIIAREGSVTGSIGVLIRSADATELLADIGIKPINIKSSPIKAVPSPMEKLSQEAEASIQLVVDGIQGFFVELVATRRGLSGDALKKVTNGRIFTGRQALSLGLVDSLGGEREALAWLETEHSISADLPVVTLQPRRSTSDWLDEAFGSLASHFHSFASGSWGAISMSPSVSH